MSQFRQDPVSGEWVILAPERAVRPHTLKKIKRRLSPKSQCPFENLEKSGNWPPILEYDEKGKWQIVLLSNKYPALRHRDRCPVIFTKGPYKFAEGIGYHELLITRDHEEDFGKLPPAEAKQVFLMFKERYQTIDADKCMAYLSIFGNWGALAGASIAHPHYQLVALPVIPPSVARSYNGSEKYYRKRKRCLHCDLVAAEKKAKKRIVAENKNAVALAPFVSQSPFEVKIFPKKHHAAFEDTPTAELAETAYLLQDILKRVRKKLNDPDYNFYIHTAPLRDKKDYAHYHWHIEVVPKTQISAGFELATGLDINPIDPDGVARLLRG